MSPGLARFYEAMRDVLVGALDRRVSDGVRGGVVGRGVEVEALGFRKIDEAGVTCGSNFLRFV